MADETFNGEKLTVTKVELGLFALLALLVASMFIGIELFIVLGVLLTGVCLVLLIYISGGRIPSFGKKTRSD
jgi:hypothetical protein